MFSHIDNASSKHSLASLRQLISLSIPSFFTLMSGSLMGFFDRLFLARDGLENLEGTIGAIYLCQIFQICLSFCASVTQVFVGQSIGAGEKGSVGSYVWQMIWFSLGSVFWILPLSFCVEHLFFQDLLFDQGIIYYRCLMLFNFLFPLGAALSGFYLGQGKMRFIMWASFAANVLNILLDYILIFGISGWIPHLGVLGAAIGTGISQLFFCFILFVDFISKKHHVLFHTRNFFFCWKKWLAVLRIGFPRAITKAIIFSAWIANIHFITKQGADFLIVLSITTSIHLLFSFVMDGMGQGITTIASFLIGKEDHVHIKRLEQTACLFLFLAAAIAFIPLVCFPNVLLSPFFTTPPSPELMVTLAHACFWLWVFIIAYGFNLIFFSFLTALGDSLFKLIYNLFSAWVFNYIPLVIAVSILKWPSEMFYGIISFGPLLSGLVYFFRFRAKKWHKLILEH